MIICYLPPITGIRKLPWMIFQTSLLVGYMFSRSLEGFGLVVKSLSSMAANLESIPSAAACAACQNTNRSTLFFTFGKRREKKRPEGGIWSWFLEQQASVDLKELCVFLVRTGRLLKFDLMASRPKAYTSTNSRCSCPGGKRETMDCWGKSCKSTTCWTENGQVPNVFQHLA